MVKLYPFYPLIRLTEYNLPAVLARCKFPKAYDAIHELTTNRGKKRNPAPAPEFGGDQTKNEARRQLVITEVKNPNNRNRLLSEKLGITAFKIPDELWERHFPQFQVIALSKFDSVYFVKEIARFFRRFEQA